MRSSVVNEQDFAADRQSRPLMADVRQRDRHQKASYSSWAVGSKTFTEFPEPWKFLGDSRPIDRRGRHPQEQGDLRSRTQSAGDR